MELEVLQQEKEALPGKPAKGKYGTGVLKQTLKLDSTQSGVEEKYFWVTRFLASREPYGRDYYGDIGTLLKVKDIYAAAETSSYWGSIEQRKGAQIDKFQQLMTNIGNMMKTLFQILRELRIIDERLDYYERSYAGQEAAEVALKGLWVDMVEQGTKNPGSVLGLAANVGFVTLPDLFFSIHPKTKEDVDKEVDKLKDAFNRKVREVLARKLFQYLLWKEKTYKELKVGKEFKLKYMRQHFNVIKLYLNWLRPYLRNIRKLQMSSSSQGIHNVDIVTAFDTSRIELEVLAIKKKYEKSFPNSTKEEREFKHFFPCIRIKLDFVAIPQMAFQEDYQRGALHRGRTVITIEGFVSTVKDINEYIKKQEEEDLDLLKAVDESIEAMKEDIDKYLKEADELLKKEEEPMIKKGRGVLNPFTSLFGGLKLLFGLSKEKVDPDEAREAEGTVRMDAYLLYKVYKQTHGMMKE